MWIVPAKSNDITKLLNYEAGKQADGVSKVAACNFVPSLSLGSDIELIKSQFDTFQNNPDLNGNFKRGYFVGNLSLAIDEKLTDDQLVNGVEKYFGLIKSEIEPIRIKNGLGPVDVVVQLNKVATNLKEYKEIMAALDSVGEEIDEVVSKNQNGSFDERYPYPYKFMKKGYTDAKAKFGQNLNTGLNERNLEVFDAYEEPLESVLEFINQ